MSFPPGLLTLMLSGLGDSLFKDYAYCYSPHQEHFIVQFQWHLPPMIWSWDRGWMEKPLSGRRVKSWVTTRNQMSNWVTQRQGGCQGQRKKGHQWDQDRFRPWVQTAPESWLLQQQHQKTIFGLEKKGTPQTRPWGTSESGFNDDPPQHQLC